MEIRKESLLYASCSDYDYIDSYEYVIVDVKNKIGVLEIAEAFAKPGPKWMDGLFALRNRIVSVFKLKTPTTAVKEEADEDGDKWEVGSRSGIFRIFGKTDSELLLGEDDKHPDVWVSLFLEPNGTNRDEKKATVTTVVKLHNRLGKCYFFFVKPVHRIIVPLLLKQKFGQLEAEANA